MNAFHLQSMDWETLTSPDTLRGAWAGLPVGVYADIFIESSCESVITLSNASVRQNFRRIRSGCGIRKIDSAYAIDYRHFPSAGRTIHHDGEDATKEVHRMQRIIEESLAEYPLVESITVRRHDIDRKIIMANRDGNYLRKSDRRIEVRVDVHHQGHAKGSSSRRMTDDNGEALRKVIQEAVRHAEADLEAVALEAGDYDVVLAAGHTAMFVHEVFGHALEADGVPGGQWSVASENVTVIDRCPNDHSCADDEGMEHRPVVLVERGRSVARLTDRTTAIATRQASTGNGRRQDYRYGPLPRMWETYLAAGNYSADEIVRSIDNGVYAQEIESGHTYSDADEVFLKITRGRRIENGKLTRPIKPLWITGRRLSLGNAVVCVGEDLKFDSRTAYCGKYGQWIPVGLGQPTVKVCAVNLGHL